MMPVDKLTLMPTSSVLCAVTQL